MKRRDSNLDPELEALITPRTIERHLPPELRARVLSRARATVAGDEIAPAPLPARPVRNARGRRLLRFALVASFAVAGAAVGAVAALHQRGPQTPEVSPGQAPAPSVPVTRGATPPPEPAAPAAEHGPAKPPHAASPKGDRFTAELDLLQRAHAAYTRRDFSIALKLVAEHAHRFPNGPLAEQSEALRVRSLLGAGRADDAHRAAAAFKVRFPRSVLLPRVAEGSASSER